MEPEEPIVPVVLLLTTCRQKLSNLRAATETNSSEATPSGNPRSERGT